MAYFSTDCGNFSEMSGMSNLVLMRSEFIAALTEFGRK